MSMWKKISGIKLNRDPVDQDQSNLAIGPCKFSYSSHAGFFEYFMFKVNGSFSGLLKLISGSPAGNI